MAGSKHVTQSTDLRRVLPSLIAASRNHIALDRKLRLWLLACVEAELPIPDKFSDYVAAIRSVFNRLPTRPQHRINPSQFTPLLHMRALNMSGERLMHGVIARLGPGYMGTSSSDLIPMHCALFALNAGYTANFADFTTIAEGVRHCWYPASHRDWKGAKKRCFAKLWTIIGPNHPEEIPLDVRTHANYINALQIAQVIQQEHTWDQLPILADALEDAGFVHPLLGHLRHGPWCEGNNVLDLILNDTHALTITPGA